MLYRLSNMLGDEVIATDREIREHALIPDHCKREIFGLANEQAIDLPDECDTIHVERIA